MKDTHNVILNLVSSKWLIPSSGVRSRYQILDFKLFIFSFRSSRLFQLYHFKAPSKSLQGFSQSSFQVSISFDHSFIIGVLHGGSTWWFVKDSLHYSIVLQDFSRSYDPPSYTQKNKHGAQHMFCFEEFKYSSSCISKCNSFYLIFWGGVMSLLAISFMFHESYVVKKEVF